jgi:NUMOD4 motif
MASPPPAVPPAPGHASPAPATRSFVDGKVWHESIIVAVTEIWHDLRGFAGYWASSWGRIRSADRTFSDRRECGGVILAPSSDAMATGDPACRRKLRTIPVHVLVPLAFIGPRWPRREVLRWDDVRGHTGRPTCGTAQGGRTSATRPGTGCVDSADCHGWDARGSVTTDERRSALAGEIGPECWDIVTRRAPTG